jgi:cephalosporin hydroxylase
MAADGDLREKTADWIAHASRYEYSYHFTWLGLPIIQFPQDIVAMQELVWRVRPDLIIETGVARGGSLILWASLLHLIGGIGEVVGIDIDIRPANRAAIEGHPLALRITLIDGSSVDPSTVERVRQIAEGHARVMVLLDSMHTHDHVLRELQLYSPLIRAGSYIVVLDTVIETMPAGSYPDRPWDRGNNPATAVEAFLRENDRFEVDREIHDKLLITMANGGYLRCIRD